MLGLKVNNPAHNPSLPWWWLSRQDWIPTSTRPRGCILRNQCNGHDLSWCIMIWFILIHAETLWLIMIYHNSCSFIVIQRLHGIYLLVTWSLRSLPRSSKVPWCSMLASRPGGRLAANPGHWAGNCWVHRAGHRTALQGAAGSALRCLAMILVPLRQRASSGPGWKHGIMCSELNWKCQGNLWNGSDAGQEDEGLDVWGEYRSWIGISRQRSPAAAVPSGRPQVVLFLTAGWMTGFGGQPWSAW